MAGSIEEKIENIDERLEQLKNQKKELLAKQREQDRKARTRRLIERGAILEQYLFEPEKLTNEQISEIVKYAFNTHYVKEYVKSFR